MKKNGPRIRRIFPYLLEPEKYRDYGRRYAKVPTWKTFADRTQGVVLRSFSQENGRLVRYREDLDLYTKKFKLGNVIWPFIDTLLTENFTELFDEIKKRGLFLFDFWGYVPGVPPADKERWGHVIPPESSLECLENILGDHFLGMDNGEQDGRYVGEYVTQMCPAYQERKKAYLNFHRYFERLGNDLGNKLSALVSLTYGHYFLKEGNTMLIGAETAQGLINSQLYYVFLRGAGKQHGVLWFGNSSIFNRKGMKNYGKEGVVSEDWGSGITFRSGPEEGSSLMLLKRLLYTHYLYNCVLVGFEDGWLVTSGAEKGGLSPIGRIQAAGVRFIEKYGQPGVMYTPVCLLLDAYSGWTPPRHLYTKRLYQVWGNIPYSAGDFLTHNVCSTLYPGYEDSSYYSDERGYLTPTPYGDIADVLLSDAEESIISTYSTVIAAGEIEPSEELRVKLENAVQKGVRLIITAGNLAGFPGGIAGLRVNKETIFLPAGTEVSFGKTTVEEVLAFRLHEVCGKPDEVVAHCQGVPAIVRKKFGEGEILLCLSPFGIGEKMSKAGKGISFDGRTLEVSLPNPHPDLAHFRRLLDIVLNEERLFDVGNDLGYIVCRKKPRCYTLGIYNNGLKGLPFRVTSRVGEIQSVKELFVDCSEKDEPGYKPTGHHKADIGRNSPETIAGGDIRIFEIRLRKERVQKLAPLKKMPAPTRRYLTLRGTGGIKEEILYRPTFFQHFSGVKVGWEYLHIRDRRALESEARWLTLQKVDVVVDFSEGLNFFPGLALLDNLDWRYTESLAAIQDVFTKMAIIGAGNAVLSLHQKPEARFDADQTSAGFLKSLKQICREAETKNILVHLQNHPDKWYGKSAEIRSFISKVNAPNLKFGLNLSHLIMNREDPGFVLNEAGNACSLVLLSVPEDDFLGQMYDAHRPVSGSKFELLLRDFLPSAAKKAIVLDAYYPPCDTEFRDISIVESCLDL